ncbi:MAG: metal-dependent hydrolase family protein [Bacillota bacterium]
MLVLKNARVLTMKDAAKTPPVAADVLIDGANIAGVGSGLAAPAGAEVIDLAGQYVLPGLIDAHCHFTYSGGLIEEDVRQTTQERVVHAVNNVFVTLMSGVTTVRDPGGVDHIDVTIRDGVRTGLIYGPRVIAGGQMIAMTGGHGWFFGTEADGPEGVRAAARRQIKARTDWVKFMASGGFAEAGEQPGSAQLDMEEMAAGVREATKAGRRTAAHAHSAAAIKNAVLAGIDSVEHASFMDDEVIDLILKRGVYITPTFSIYHKMIRDGSRFGLKDELIELVRQAWDLKVERFLKAYRAGVKVASGTDSGSPTGFHGNFADELELLVKVGLTPYEALRIATVNSSTMLGLQDQIGTVEAGKRADLIVLPEDPLGDVARAVRGVRMVFKDGQAYRVGGDTVSLPARA